MGTICMSAANPKGGCRDAPSNLTARSSMYWKKFAVRRPLPQKGKEVVLAALMNGFVRPVCVNMVEFHDTFWH